MTSKHQTDSGAPGAMAPGADEVNKKPQRISAKMKTQIVKRLLRGESMDLLAREYCNTAAKISQWREDFLTAGEVNPKNLAPISLCN